MKVHATAFITDEKTSYLKVVPTYEMLLVRRKYPVGSGVTFTEHKYRAIEVPSMSNELVRLRKAYGKMFDVVFPADTFDKCFLDAAGKKPAAPAPPKDETEYIEDDEVVALPTEEINGIGHELAEDLAALGYETVVSIADAKVEDLAEVKGISKKSALKIKTNALEIATS